MDQEIEVWKPIINYEGIYEISNLGKIKSFPKDRFCFGHKRTESTKLIKTDTFHPSGYRFVTLIKDKVRKSYAVHRLVGIHFIDNPENLPQINHKDTIKTNNIYSNLEWCTNFYNQQHAIENGLVNYVKGEKHGGAKLKEIDIPVIRRLFSEGLNKHQIAEIYGIHPKHAYSINMGKAWKHVHK